ncbi:MAG TPA: hypothetical protein VIS27_05360 [Yeosuana sp.]
MTVKLKKPAILDLGENYILKKATDTSIFYRNIVKSGETLGEIAKLY